MRSRLGGCRRSVRPERWRWCSTRAASFQGKCGRGRDAKQMTEAGGIDGDALAVQRSQQNVRNCARSPRCAEAMETARCGRPRRVSLTRAPIICCPGRPRQSGARRSRTAPQRGGPQAHRRCPLLDHDCAHRFRFRWHGRAGQAGVDRHAWRGQGQVAVPRGQHVRPACEEWRVIGAFKRQFAANAACCGNPGAGSWMAERWPPNTCCRGQLSIARKTSPAKDSSTASSVARWVELTAAMRSGICGGPRWMPS